MLIRCVCKLIYICVKINHLFSHCGFPGGTDGKASAYNVGDLSSIPGLGRYSGEGNETHYSILAWKIPWVEEPGRLRSMGSQRVGQD